MSHDAPDEVIRAAYRALANKYHPDRNPGDRGAEFKLKRLNAAYQVLGDPAKRKQYDELTQGPEGCHEGPPEPPKQEPPPWKVPEEQASPRGKVPEEERAAREPRHEPPPDKPRSVLRMIFRVVGIIVGLFVLGLGGVIWYGTDQDAKYKADQASVTITATYDPADCRNPKYPIQVTIVNSSSTRTVKTVTFDLEAYEEGRSDNLVSSTDGTFKESTRVVRPGVTKTTCWSLPSFTRAVSNGVSFRANKEFVNFYGENEVIPPEPADVIPPEPASTVHDKMAPSDPPPSASPLPLPHPRNTKCATGAHFDPALGDCVADLDPAVIHALKR